MMVHAAAMHSCGVVHVIQAGRHYPVVVKLKPQVIHACFSTDVMFACFSLKQ